MSLSFLKRQYIHQENFYTGTDIQPDILSIFVKEKNNGKTAFFHLKSNINCNGYIPGKSILNGVRRIIVSVKVIFNEFNFCRLHFFGCWNAFKNLFRGVIELIPIAGNISLMIFDYACEKLIIQSMIEKEISEKNSIVGIALDGKVILTFDLHELKRFYANGNPTNEECSEAFGQCCMLALQDVIYRNLKIKECILGYICNLKKIIEYKIHH